MSRLNLTQMVNKTLLGQQENKFFNVSQIFPDNYFESQKYAAKIKQAKDRLNLDEKIESFIFNVNEQMKVRQTSPNPSRPKLKLTEKKLKKGLKRAIHDETDKNVCENITIPHMKVLGSDKQKERFHKTTETSCRCLSYESHKRMLLAQQRKFKLENMIEQHKLLKADRQSLEQDIFAMRHFLSDLQNRVNSSIQQLHNKKTFCECHGLLNNNNCDKCKENS